MGGDIHCGKKGRGGQVAQGGGKGKGGGQVAQGGRGGKGGKGGGRQVAQGGRGRHDGHGGGGRGLGHGEESLEQSSSDLLSGSKYNIGGGGGLGTVGTGTKHELL